jgi:opacity protein-like surface antigen
LRYPLFKDRLVPYVIAGIGPSWLQAKDVKPSGFDKQVEVEGFSYSVAAGLGLEYFIADNVTFGVEGKYVWVNPIDGTVDGEPQVVDLSSPLFTFGLRVYFDENHPRRLMSEEAKPTSRFYFGVRLGSDFLTDDRWMTGVRFGPEQAAWGGVASQTGGLLLGADLGDNWGIELAGDHVNHLVEVDGVGATTEYGQGWVLASLRLRYPMRRWVPYVLIGAGACYTELKDGKVGSRNLHQEGGGFHPAVGVGGGFEYFIARNFSIGAEVRWGYSWGHEYELENHIARGSGDLSYLAATIGFRVYVFDL